MSADSDYARVVELLSRQHLAPYVSYAEADHVTGMAHVSQEGGVVVRVSDGKTVPGKSHVEMGIHTSYDEHDSNPIANPVFDAKCYRATGEEPATYNDAPALKFDLKSIGSSNKDDNDKDASFTTLYVEPHSLRPIDATGLLSSGEDAKDVKVSVDQSSAYSKGRSLPNVLHIDVAGSGWMFWLQVHVNVIYSNYQFLDTYTPQS